MFLISNEIIVETQRDLKKVEGMWIMTLKMNALDWKTVWSTRVF